MFSYYVDFVKNYAFLSMLCLIKDLFLEDNNIVKYSNQQVIQMYKYNYKGIIRGLGNISPFILFLDLFTIHCSETHLFFSLLQVSLCIYFGYFMHLIARNYIKKEPQNNERHIFIFNTVNITPKELYFVYLLPYMVFPLVIGISKDCLYLLYNTGMVFSLFKNSNSSTIDFGLNFIEKRLMKNEFEEEVHKIFKLLFLKLQKFKTSTSTSDIVEEQEQEQDHDNEEQDNEKQEQDHDNQEQDNKKLQ